MKSKVTSRSKAPLRSGSVPDDLQPLLFDCLLIAHLCFAISLLPALPLSFLSLNLILESSELIKERPLFLPDHLRY